jgi:hypothetical protein
MLLRPLEQWICDHCGEIIESPEQGFLEWIRDENDKRYDFKIVHHAPYSPRRPSGHCYHHDDISGRQDLPLKHFVGGEGSAHLLSFLDVGPYHEEDYPGPRVRDIREFVELMRRLTIPYYEEARLYWGRAMDDGFFGGASEVAMYHTENMKIIVERYGEPPEP